MKQKRTLFAGIAIGILTSFLVSMMVVPGFAAGIRKTITAYVGDIDIYVDNVLKIPTDVNGNRVEPMIYDGTTYLPVRAISNMLGEEVTWDGETRSIYIGKKPEKGSQSVTLDSLTPYDSYNASLRTGSSAEFSVYGEDFTPFNRMYVPSKISISHATYHSGDLTYKLDSNYTKLAGSFVVASDHLGCDDTHTLRIYNVDQYGTETVLKEYTLQAGDTACPVSVDISGCNFIKIDLNSNGHAPYSFPVFYDISLTTAN